jgi:enolase
VEATVSLSDGTVATSSVPSGSVSNDQNEAMELRDHNSSEYFGFGVSKAVELINTEIGTKLIGFDPLYQTKIDQTLVDLDGTKNKSRLGANSILAVSQAVMKAAAASLHLPLFVYVKEKYQLIDAYRIPTPIFNLINGGRHGGGTLDFQEFQLVPASHLPYTQALKIGTEMFMAVGQVLEQKGALTSVGLEGGYAPNLASNSDALEIFNEAAKVCSYTISKDAFLGIDLAPQNFYKNGKYTIKDKSQPMSGKEFVKYLKGLHEQYRVFALEDPLVPDAWPDWKFITAELGQTAMIIADDLVATNKTLLMKAIEEKACNALVIKPNRVGTITEAIEIASLAKKAGWHTIMSHRSSETTDDVLADVAVGIGTDYVKFGAPSRGERVVKYNRLLRIEEILRASSGQTSKTQERTDMSAAQPTAQEEPTPPIQTPPQAPAMAPIPTSLPVSEPAPAPVTTPLNLGTPPTQPTPMYQPARPVMPATPAPTPAAASFAPPVTASPFPQSPPPQPVVSPAPAPAPAPALINTTPVYQPTVAPTATLPPEVTLSVPTSQPAPVIAPAEVFATPVTPPSTLPSATSESDSNEEVIQDSLNELVQMVGDVPLEEQPELGQSTTPAPSVARPPVMTVPTQSAPTYANLNISDVMSQSTLAESASSPAPTISPQPAPPIQPVIETASLEPSGLPRPTRPSFGAPVAPLSSVNGPTTAAPASPAQNQGNGLQPPSIPEN